MEIYWFVLSYMILGRIFAKRHKKIYVVSCFVLLILVAGLRSYSIGIDLERHYARNFSIIANTDWKNLSKFTYVGGYDMGFVVFCKFISYLSSDPQCLIMISSIITFGLIGRYIYLYSDDVALETFLFFSSMIYFMYLNIVAQALAIAIVVLGLDRLVKKQYLRFILWVVLASTMHSSAIVCVLFVPLSILPLKRKYVFRYIILVIVAMLGFEQVINYVFTHVFTNFSYYLTNSSYIDGRGVSLSKFNLFQILFTVMCVVIPYVCLYHGRETINSYQVEKWKLKKYKGILKLKKEIMELSYLNNNFYMYVAITGIVCRVLITKMAIMERMGYYFYFMGFSILCRATESIENKGNKRIILTCIYIFMFFFFMLFGKSAGEQSYGVVPYKFL